MVVSPFNSELPTRRPDRRDDYHSCSDFAGVWSPTIRPPPGCHGVFSGKDRNPQWRPSEKLLQTGQVRRPEFQRSFDTRLTPRSTEPPLHAGRPTEFVRKNCRVSRGVTRVSNIDRAAILGRPLSCKSLVFSGGAERDRTVDLLNAIRTAVFDPDRRCLTRIHSVNDRVERQSGHCPFFFDRGSSRLVSLDSAYSLTRGA